MGRVVDLDEFFYRWTMGGMSRWMMVVVACAVFGCESYPTHVSLWLGKGLAFDGGIRSQTAMVTDECVRGVQNDGRKMSWECNSVEAALWGRCRISYGTLVGLGDKAEKSISICERAIYIRRDRRCVELEAACHEEVHHAAQSR